MQDLTPLICEAWCDAAKQIFISEMLLFDSLSVEEPEHIEKRLVYKELEKDAVVYRQGTEGRSVCFVVDGELSIVRCDDEGDVVIATVGKGQSVEEMVLIDGLTRSEDVAHYIASQ